MNYLKQIYYEMRHHKMMTWVSISGTALAIFLVMSFIMADRIKTVELAPETNRSRIMTGINFHTESVTNNNAGSTWGINADLIKRLYGNLDGVETISYIMAWNNVADVNVKGGESFSLEMLKVDENFWKVYDFRFIDGRPFNEGERKSEVKDIVITRSKARQLFGEENVAGREVEIDMIPYNVVGVVEDVSPLLGNTFAKIYGIYNIDGDEGQDNPWFGNSAARILLKEGKDPQEVKKQVEGRYKQLASEAEKDGVRVIYHDQPYTAEDYASGISGSNRTPETAQGRRLQWIIYAILILVPALNLSSMTRSRLRHRVAEIGVRRAFGAKRVDIIFQLFGENLLITLIGGALGLILSLVFILFASTFLFSYSSIFSSSFDTLTATPSLGMVFSWGTFFIAFGVCFVLNILSATVPAWRASLVEPAVALSSR